MTDNLLQKHIIDIEEIYVESLKISDFKTALSAKKIIVDILLKQSKISISKPINDDMELTEDDISIMEIISKKIHHKLEQNL